ncbi:unnamed protein product [Danaus chrysippus]|uniref:(African queen) hypothetical protein n=1 Tax=Danaus chrysippus TaxID=151541 RepID=A0A8J2VXJ7_9NEOP|nr:unnamed protein product [Danaus chrysippus]
MYSTAVNNYSKTINNNRVSSARVVWEDQALHVKGDAEVEIEKYDADRGKQTKQIGKARPRGRIKVTVLPKLQYCRVVSRECCGAGGAAYTSDAVERHLCSLRVPCERERRTARVPAGPPAPGAGPPQAPVGPPPGPAGPPQPPPGPFIYNTHTQVRPPTHPYRRTRTPPPPLAIYVPADISLCGDTNQK